MLGLSLGWILVSLVTLPLSEQSSTSAHDVVAILGEDGLRGRLGKNVDRLVFSANGIYGDAAPNDVVIGMVVLDIVMLHPW